MDDLPMYDDEKVLEMDLEVPTASDPSADKKKITAQAPDGGADTDDDNTDDDVKVVKSSNPNEAFRYKSRVPQKLATKRKRSTDYDVGYGMQDDEEMSDEVSEKRKGARRRPKKKYEEEDNSWVRRSARQTNVNPKYADSGDADFLDEEVDTDDTEDGIPVGQMDFDTNRDESSSSSRPTSKRSAAENASNYIAEQKIEVLLGRKTGGDGTQMYLVKWKGTAYIHATWESEASVLLFSNGSQHLSRFSKKAAWGKVYIDINDDYFNPDYSTIDRIIARRTIKIDPRFAPLGTPVPNIGPGEGGKGASTELMDLTQYLVKWRSLQYQEATWEATSTLERLGMNDEIKRYLKISAPPPLSQRKSLKAASREVRPRKFNELKESPADFKHGHMLRSYQLEGMNWLCYNWHQGRNSILADEMGLGKTVQSVSLFHYLHSKQGLRGPFLVVAPLSTISHWQREVESWTEMHAVVYHGSAASREIIRKYEWGKFEPANSTPRAITHGNNDGSRELVRIPGMYRFHILITTYEMVLKDQERLCDINWACMIVDEAHRLKNRTSSLFKALNTFRINHCVLLTGTPIQNKIVELGTLLHFLEPARFHDIDAFERQFGDLQKKAQVDALHALLRPYLLRRMKGDVEKALPPREETLVEVELTRAQKQYYKAIYEKNTQYLMSKTGTKPSLMNIGMQLRKCCNHPFLLDGAEEAILAEDDEKHDSKSQSDKSEVKSVVKKENKPRTYASIMKKMVISCGKLVLVDKLLPKLKKQGHRVLIFSQMVRVLDILEDYLRYRSYSYERLDGTMKSSDRQAGIDRFSRKGSDIFVFLLCTRAGGVGINLTAADTVIIYDSDWNPQNDIQAQARCHRIGQTKNVKVYRLVTRNTYESEMFHRASLKLGLDKAVLHSMTEVAGSAHGNKNKAMDKTEVEALLKHGAYHVFLNSDSAKADEFCEQDIDQILERNSRVVTMGDDESVKGNSTFSKATFVADERNVDINDPDFWTKLGLKKIIPTQLYLGARKRTLTRRFGMAKDEEDFEDLTDETGADSEDYFDDGVGTTTLESRDVFVNWKKREREAFFHCILSFGPYRWDDMRAYVPPHHESGKRISSEEATPETTPPLEKRSDEELLRYFCGMLFVLLRIIEASSQPAVQHTILNQILHQARRLQPTPTQPLSTPSSTPAMSSATSPTSVPMPSPSPTASPVPESSTTASPTPSDSTKKTKRKQNISDRQKELVRVLQKVGCDPSLTSPIFLSEIAKKARSHLLTIERLWILHQVMTCPIFHDNQATGEANGNQPEIKTIKNSQVKTIKKESDSSKQESSKPEDSKDAKRSKWCRKGDWENFAFSETFKLKEAKAGPPAEWWTREDDTELIKGCYLLGVGEHGYEAMREHALLSFRRHQTENLKKSGKGKQRSYGPDGSKLWPSVSTLNKRFTMLISALSKDLKKYQREFRVKRKKKVKQVKSAWMFFSKKVWNSVKAENPESTFSEVGKKVGERWKLLTAEEKAPYVVLHKEDLARYREDRRQASEEEDNVRDNKGGTSEPSHKKRKIKAAKSAWMFFNKAKLANAKTENPEKSYTQICKTLAGKWRGLSAEEKNPYLELQSEDLARYNAEVDANGGPKAAQRKKFKVKVAKSAWMFFNRETWLKTKEQNPEMTFSDIGKAVGRKWKALTNEDKIPYQKQYELDLVRYKTELKAAQLAEEKRERDGITDPKSVAVETRQLSAKKVKVKPVKSAWVFFSKQEWSKVKADYPELGFRHVGKKVGERWKALSPEEKAPFVAEQKADAKRYHREKEEAIKRAALSPTLEGGDVEGLKERAKPKSKIKQVKSAWIYFSKETWGKVKQDHPEASFSDVGRKVGELWKALAKEEKMPFVKLQKEDAARYREEKRKEREEGGVRMTRGGHGRQNAHNEIRGPRRVNPARPVYMCFSQKCWKQVNGEKEGQTFSEINVRVAQIWKELNDEGKKEYQALADKDLERYKHEVKKAKEEWEQETKKTEQTLASTNRNANTEVVQQQERGELGSIKTEKEESGTAGESNNAGESSVKMEVEEEIKTSVKESPTASPKLLSSSPQQQSPKQHLISVLKKEVPLSEIPLKKETGSEKADSIKLDPEESSDGVLPQNQDAVKVANSETFIRNQTIAKNVEIISGESRGEERDEEETSSDEEIRDQETDKSDGLHSVIEPTTVPTSSEQARAGGKRQRDQADSVRVKKKPRIAGLVGLKRCEIKKAKSAWMFFSKEMWDTVREDMPKAAFGDIGKYLGETWKALSPKEKEPYVEKSVRDKVRFDFEVEHSAEERGRGAGSGSTGRIKQAKSAWTFFSKDMWAQIRKENLSATFAEMGKLVGSRWRALSTEAKQKYNLQHDADVKRYQADIEKSRGPPAMPKTKSKQGGSPIAKSTQSDSKNGDTVTSSTPKPKTAKTAWQFYSKENWAKIKKEHPDAKFGDVGRMMGTKWKTLTAEEKLPYEMRSKQDQDRISLEKLKMGDTTNTKQSAKGSQDGGKGSTAPKGKVGKDGKIKVKNALSAWMFFSKAKWAEHKAENPEADFAAVGRIVGNNWKALSAEEKMPYIVMHEKDVIRYIKDREAAGEPQITGGGSGGRKGNRGVKAATTAFVFFSRELRPKIKADNPGMPLDQVRRMLSDRWRTILPEDKQKYTDLHQKDVLRAAEERRELHQKDLLRAAKERRELALKAAEATKAKFLQGEAGPKHQSAGGNAESPKNSTSEASDDSRSSSPERDFDRPVYGMPGPPEPRQGTKEQHYSAPKSRENLGTSSREMHESSYTMSPPMIPTAVEEWRMRGNIGTPMVRYPQESIGSYKMQMQNSAPNKFRNWTGIPRSLSPPMHAPMQSSMQASSTSIQPSPLQALPMQSAPLQAPPMQRSLQAQRVQGRMEPGMQPAGMHVVGLQVQGMQPAGVTAYPRGRGYVQSQDVWGEVRGTIGNGMQGGFYPYNDGNLVMQPRQQGGMGGYERQGNNGMGTGDYPAWRKEDVYRSQ